MNPDPTQRLTAYFSSLFSIPCSHGIIGHMEGDEEGRCGDCHFFQINRPDLPLFDNGVDVIGRCNSWEAHTSAHKRCIRYMEGEADVR